MRTNITNNVQMQNMYTLIYVFISTFFCVTSFVDVLFAIEKMIAYMVYECQCIQHFTELRFIFTFFLVK